MPLGLGNLFVLTYRGLVHCDHAARNIIVGVQQAVRVVDVHYNRRDLVPVLSLKGQIDSLVEDWIAVVFNNSRLFNLLVAILEHNEGVRCAVRVGGGEVTGLEDVGPDGPDGHAFLWRLLPGVEVLEVYFTISCFIVNRKLK
jgi:hypothetical protein